MKYRITPQLITLSYEATLKSFWRKNSLKKFLRECSISEKHLNSWNPDETKREFLDKTFDALQNNEKGKKVILKMAVSLAEQIAFPDLRNWEDSEEKIKDAKISVTELKKYLDKQNEEIINEEKKIEKRRKSQEESAKIQRQITDKSKLQEKLNRLCSLLGTQDGGYQFQSWFYDLLDFCEIDNKRPYSIDNRQIDGSLTHEGTTYLVELKFTSQQSSATDIDSIKSKIDKMADNTMGIMVSMSGYSSVSISEASGRKTTLLLMDSSHLFLYLTGGIEFKHIISRIRRHASQTGESFLPVDKFGY